MVAVVRSRWQIRRSLSEIGSLTEYGVSYLGPFLPNLSVLILEPKRPHTGLCWALVPWRGSPSVAGASHVSSTLRHDPGIQPPRVRQNTTNVSHMAAYGPVTRESPL